MSSYWYAIFSFFPTQSINLFPFRFTRQRTKSNRTHLLLTDLTVNSTGQYTCELSSDPDYHTTYRDGQLQVLRKSRTIDCATHSLSLSLDDVTDSTDLTCITARPAASSSSSTASSVMYTFSTCSTIINLSLTVIKSLFHLRSLR